MNALSDDPLSLSRHTKEGWLVIFCGFCLYFLASPLYLWGDLMIYVFSYLRQYDPNSSLDSLSWVFPIAFLISQVTTSYTETLLSHFSVAKLSFFGFLFTISGLFFCSELQNTLYFIVIFSVFIGISQGLLSMLPIICGLRFFPDNKARVIGLINLGGAAGCFCIGIFNTYLINANNLRPLPDKVYFNECVANQIPRGLKLMACSYTVLSMIGISYLQVPRNFEPKNEGISLIIREENSKKRGNCIGLLGLLSLEGMFFLMFYKVIGLEMMYDDRTVTWIGVVGVSLICLCKIPWNLLNKTRKAVLLIIGMQIFAKIAIIFSFSIAILLEFGSLAGVFAVHSRVLIEFFEFKTAKKLNRITLITFGVGALFICCLQNKLILLQPLFWLGFLGKDLACLVLFEKVFEGRGWEESRKNIGGTNSENRIFEEENAVIKT